MTCYLIKGVTMPVEFELRTGLNTVGRNPTNDFCLREASVSSFHAEMTVLEDGSGVVVRDLQSTNGTFVDGNPVEEANVSPGQALQFGSVALRLMAQRIQITVPAPPVVETARPPGAAAFLPDGSPACSCNPQLPATHEAIRGCHAVVKCPGVFNVASLRAVKLSGGKAGVLLFCPACNAKCRPIAGATGSNQTKRGLFSRLTQTIRLVRKK
jgi:hypothetical protein